MTDAEPQPRDLIIARLLVLALIVAFVALFPRALPDAPSRQGFVGGFLHPIEGFDHRLAMVAVGMWGVALGRPLIWTLPIAFPLVMAVGGSMSPASRSDGRPIFRAARSSCVRREPQRRWSGRPTCSKRSIFLRSTVALAVITVVCAAMPLWSFAHAAADALPPFWMGVRQL